MTKCTFSWTYQKVIKDDKGSEAEFWFLTIDGTEYAARFIRYNDKAVQAYNDMRQANFDNGWKSEQSKEWSPGEIHFSAHRAYRNALPFKEIRAATDNGKTLFALSDNGVHFEGFWRVCPDVVMPETIEKELDFLDLGIN